MGWTAPRRAGLPAHIPPNRHDNHPGLDDDAYVSITEAAVIARVSRRTIYNWLPLIRPQDKRITPKGLTRIRVGALFRGWR